MNNFFPGMIMGFREGLEAFLIIAVILRYLGKIKMEHFKKYVWRGVVIGIILSLFIGGVLKLFSNSINDIGSVAKIWESGASIIALILVTTFIIWMINHGRNMIKHVENEVSDNLSVSGIILISIIMISREGAEIAIFTFAGRYSNVSVFTGIAIALIISILVFYSLIKIKLNTIFNITLIYLILQAGFLLGYGIHEGLSALKDLNYLSKDNMLYTKVFDLSKTILNHKEGKLGLPLYVIFGWYSKPEWIQFLVQYIYTISIFTYWVKKKN